jgi:hypothetical protein
MPAKYLRLNTQINLRVDDFLGSTKHIRRSTVGHSNNSDQRVTL